MALAPMPRARHCHEETSSDGGAGGRRSCAGSLHPGGSGGMHPGGLRPGGSGSLCPHVVVERGKAMEVGGRRRRRRRRAASHGSRRWRAGRQLGAGWRLREGGGNHGLLIPC